MINEDRLQLFTFATLPVRGVCVHLHTAFEEIASSNRYAEPVRQLLGEMLAASAMLANLVKDADLVLQARGNRGLRVVMAETRQRTNLRGIARGALESIDPVDAQAEVANVATLLGKGDLAMTVTPQRGPRSQGLVPLEANSIADCIEQYFEQSEQLPTRLWLTARDGIAAGLLLQRIPDLPEQSEIAEAIAERAWNDVQALGAAITAGELRDQPPQRLLEGLFWPHQIQWHQEYSLRARCSCSNERSLNVLRMLGREEVETTLRQEGIVEMHCEFCGARYAYDRDALSSILDHP